MQPKTVAVVCLISLPGLKLDTRLLSLNFTEREHFSGTDLRDLVLENTNWV
jgi:hypothetical protein